MKLTKTEKIWLTAVIIFYVCYNLPFVPPYNNAKATFVHALLTLIPLWITIYVGLIKVCKIYRIKEDHSIKEENLINNAKSVHNSDSIKAAESIHNKQNNGTADKLKNTDTKDTPENIQDTKEETHNA